MQADADGRIWMRDLLKRLIRNLLPVTTDQKVGGSSPSERASPEAICDHEMASTLAETIAKVRYDMESL